jgi:hypothetical protein
MRSLLLLFAFCMWRLLLVGELFAFQYCCTKSQLQKMVESLNDMVSVLQSLPELLALEMSSIDNDDGDLRLL